MKKLIALSLSVVMVLAFAAVSMAATVTIGGELDFGKTWHNTGTLHEYQGSESNVSNAKVTFTAQIADDIKAFAALKGNSGDNVNVDETWVQFTEDYGTIKIGYFGYSQDQKDIIDDVIPDVKSGLTVSYAVKLTDQITLNLAAANDGTATGTNPWEGIPGLSGRGLDYSVGFAYDTDNFGVNGNYFKFAKTNLATAFSLMGYYKLDVLKFYAQYQTNKSWWWESGPANRGVENFILGGVYDSTDVPLFVRAEYDFDTQHTGTSEWALRLAYKMTGDVKLQYTVMRHNQYYADFTVSPVNVDNYTTSELLLITTF